MALPSEHLEALITELSRLPGIGRKSAARAAFYILDMSSSDVKTLAASIERLKEMVRECSICGGISDSEICSICADSARPHNTICVVESKKDVLTIEKTGAFHGMYHVLQGVISPLDGIGPDDLRFKELFERCEKEKVSEVIMATNPTIEGDATVLYATEILKKMGIRVMRLARGLPVGADIDFADMATISKSLDERHEV